MCSINSLTESTGVRTSSLGSDAGADVDARLDSSAPTATAPQQTIAERLVTASSRVGSRLRVKSTGCSQELAGSSRSDTSTAGGSFRRPDSICSPTSNTFCESFASIGLQDGQRRFVKRPGSHLPRRAVLVDQHFHLRWLELDAGCFRFLARSGHVAARHDQQVRRFGERDRALPHLLPLLVVLGRGVHGSR